MVRDGFIFYRSFYEAIRDLPRDIQGEICTAIMEYGLNGIETDNLKSVARSVFTLVKPQIDANNKKYENGKKGGAPKGSRNNPNGRKTKELRQGTNQELTKNKPRTNQELTKNKPKEKEKEKDKDKEKDFIKKPHPDGCVKEKPPCAFSLAHDFGDDSETSEDYRKFITWLCGKAPYCAQNMAAPSENELRRLKERYGSKAVADTILEIENRKDLRKRYTNLYRTALNWLKRDKGDGNGDN
ncbi:MAG: DUF6291 domain-containing protein [Prevotellaceae bacterium]|nr:DUF6291 domain-containing protein [Prevotellaceae bacterium]